MWRRWTDFLRVAFWSRVARVTIWTGSYSGFELVLEISQHSEGGVLWLRSPFLRGLCCDFIDAIVPKGHEWPMKSLLGS